MPTITGRSRAAVSPLILVAVVATLLAAAVLVTSPAAGVPSAVPSQVGGCTPGQTGDPLPSPAVTATRIRGGFAFLEGPVWVAAGGYLLLSDLQNATGPENVQPVVMRRFTPPDTFDVFIPDSGSNGLAISGDGQTVLAATHDQRSVSSYRLADKARGVVASTFQGRRFNSPNDLTVRSDGTVYFTDPNFQRGNRADEMGGRTDVFRVSGGQVSLVDDTVGQPNGVVLSPDEQTLYVGGNADNRIYAYPVLPDGSTGQRRDFAALSGPDGVTADCAGNLYWASFNDGRVHVLSPAGQEIGTITAGRNTTNVAFGGPDQQTLYITSGTTGDFGLYSVHLNIPGYPY